MNELSKLFGSVERVRLIRFFCATTGDPVLFEDIEDITKVKGEVLKKELQALEKSTLILKSKDTFSEFKDGKINTHRNKINYKLNPEFRFLDTLKAFAFDFRNANRDVLLEKFKAIGRTKLFLLSGVFIGEEKTRVDILYVGEGVKYHASEKLKSDILAELGVVLKIHIMDIEEFDYRYKMYDRFIRDTLSGPKEVLIDKLKL
jgi:hypothetical protein